MRLENPAQWLQRIQHPQSLDPRADVYCRATLLHRAYRPLRHTQAFGEGGHGVIACQPSVTQALAQFLERDGRFANLLHKVDSLRLSAVTGNAMLVMVAPLDLTLGPATVNALMVEI